MHTRNILALFFIGALALTSCKNELEPQESSGTELTKSDEAANAPAPLTSGASAQPVPTMQPQTIQSPNGMVQVNPQAVPPPPVAKGMNPPHGQPNHRCDIAVGAPLNSPPGKPAATPQTQTIPTQGTTASGQPYTLTPAKMNADGTLSPGSPTPASTTPSLLATPAATPAGMNPPHGQDGHRCDVAVGAPFPKS